MTLTESCSVILGIDPGSRITGYGVIRMTGSKIHHIDNGIIKPKSDELGDRIHTIYKEILQLIDTFLPTVAAIESIFVAKNANSALLLGHARGAAMIATTQKNLPLFEYSAREVKKSLVGTGAAQKAQVQQMTKRLLGLPEVAAEDAADALAVAICHANRSKMEKLLRLAAEQHRIGPR